jgi:nucleoside-diphosphate-sugar epimerase
MRDVRLLVFGLGYVGSAVARTAAAANFAVAGTTRSPGTGIGFDDAAAEMAQATHVLSTVPPDKSGDPVLARHGDAIAGAPDLRWIGYLSTTGVYGDRGGGWVDEDTVASPTSDRGRRRLQAEEDWRRFADRRAVDVFRLAGIYGPRRSVFTICAGEPRGASASRATRSDASIATTSCER